MEGPGIDIENTEMQQALQILEYSRRSLFLTGKAGTGKSTFLRYVDKHLKKKHVVLAPTGIAAINAGGSTLHSFFKLPFHPLLPNDTRYNVRNMRNTLKYTSEKRKLLQELELIIIDEISMVRADIIDFIDRILRIYCRNMREPFGGKQLLLVGDVYQLEPVVKEEDKQLLSPFYQNLFFFNAQVFKEFNLVSIELNKVYRQSDPTFINILDHIRTSQITQRDISAINARVDGAETESTEGKLSITLSTRRDTVDYINQEKLAQLPGEVNMYRGLIKGEFPDNSLPTPIELELKLGAQVLFIKNDKEKRWVNGTLGTIIGFSDEESMNIYVHTEEGEDVEVEREIWRNVRYTFNEEEKKIEEEEIGTYEQFPLRLAWAITVHKSQGLTFNNVKIDFTGGVFAGGQTYVALSRCTSLEGISLKEPIRPSDVFVRGEVQNFARQFNDERLIGDALKQTRADKEYHDAIVAFKEGDMKKALDTFLLAIHSRYDIEKPVQRRFFQMLLHRKQQEIGKVQEELQRTKDMMKVIGEEIREQNKVAKEFAVEFCLMGKECEKEGFRDAAIKNYEKALRLCPDMPEAKRRLAKLKE